MTRRSARCRGTAARSASRSYRGVARTASGDCSRDPCPPVLCQRSHANGSNVAYQLVTIKGIEYAAFPALAGAYIVTYTPDTSGPTVTARSPAVGATNVARRHERDGDLQRGARPGHGQHEHFRAAQPRWGAGGRDGELERCHAHRNAHAWRAADGLEHLHRDAARRGDRPAHQGSGRQRPREQRHVVVHDQEPWLSVHHLAEHRDARRWPLLRTPARSIWASSSVPT